MVQSTSRGAKYPIKTVYHTLCLSLAHTLSLSEVITKTLHVNSIQDNSAGETAHNSPPNVIYVL